MTSPKDYRFEFSTPSYTVVLNGLTLTVTLQDGPAFSTTVRTPYYENLSQALDLLGYTCWLVDNMLAATRDEDSDDDESVGS